MKNPTHRLIFHAGWQNAEDPQGNPFLAIVLDPLRSAAKNSAALAAFRAYPPAYTPPANQCPDGEICADDARRVEVWGSCWHRYYQLDLEYFTVWKSSRRRVDGVEVDATSQHERAVKF